MLAAKVDSSIKRARLAAALAVERLKQQVAEAQAQQYPGDHIGPRKWLNLISGLLDTASEYLQQSTQSGIALKSEADLIRDAAHLATQAFQCLVLMRGAGTDELSYSIVSPLDRWFSQLKIENDTFFRAELVANYELLSIPESPFRGVRNPTSKLTKAIDEIEWPFLRVTVPGKAFSIVPHLAIVAHEIGHALFDKIAWDISSFTNAHEVTLLNEIKKRLGVNNLDGQTLKFLNRVFKNWWEEFSADAFAFYLTGPAIFFSLPEFCQFLASSYGLSETHPANDIRRSVLYSKLNEGNEKSFATIFKKHTQIDLTEEFNSPLIVVTPAPDQIYADVLSVTRSKEKAAVLAELHPVIIHLVPMIYQHVHDYLKTHANDAIYYPDRFDRDLEDHLISLLGAVPPIETGSLETGKSPTEFASILNVGWTVILTKLSDLQVKTIGPDSFGAEKTEQLQGLLLKAVELSEARRIWQG